MMPWQYKQKTPGFGIAKSFYLSVLSGVAQLPPILKVVEPGGLLGAVAGFGAPLSLHSDKAALGRPMERGAYAIASKNRKTVLKLMIIPKEEAGYDPAPFLRSEASDCLSQEHKARISATWSLLQLTFETHEAAVYESLKFLMQIAARLADLTGGVVSDPLSQRYLLPSEVFHQPQADPRIDARDYVRAMTSTPKQWAYTLGLQKFALPEIEIFGVPESLQGVAERFLLGISQTVLLGSPLQIGRHLGSPKCSFQIGHGGLDRSRWEGIDCFELIPPTGSNAAACLLEWQNRA